MPFLVGSCRVRVRIRVKVRVRVRVRVKVAAVPCHHGVGRTVVPTLVLARVVLFEATISASSLVSGSLS